MDKINFKKKPTWSMIKISIIIPTYKPKDYLWECLDAICRQTFPKEDFETDAVATIICNGDCIGAVAICGKTEEEWKEKSILQLVQTAGSFIGKQLES